MATLVLAAGLWIVVVLGVFLLTVGARQQGERGVTDIVDYDGVVRAADGPVPLFLWFIYAAVTALALAVAIAALTGRSL